MTFEVDTSFLNNLILIRSYFERVIQELIQRGFPVIHEKHIDFVRTNIKKIVHHLEITINSLKQFISRSGVINSENNVKPTTTLNKPDFLKVLGLDMVNNNETYNASKVSESFSSTGSGSYEVKGVWDASLSDLNKKDDVTGEKPILRPKPVVKTKACLSVDKGKALESTLHKIHEGFPKTATSNSTCITSTVNSETGCESGIKGRNENCIPRVDISSGTARNSIRSYSLKYLNVWENSWEETENPIAAIKKRNKEEEKDDAIPVYTVSGRIHQFERKQKRISSTVEGFLDIFDNDKSRRRSKLKEIKPNFSLSSSAIPNMKEEEEGNDDEFSVASETEDNYDSSNGGDSSTESEQETITEVKNQSLLPIKAKSLGNLTMKNNNLRIMYDFSNGNVFRSKSDRLPRIVDVIYKKKPH